MARSGGPAKGRGHSTKSDHGPHGGKHRKKFTKGGVGSRHKSPHTKQPKKGTRGTNVHKKGGRVP